ncbi:MAG: transporter substrate-binding domain-containing protein [Rhodospirillaceae bacterium]|nr:transporter substrate-binding domain-containing protein [Rhodospirillaceae bacterium]
MTQTYPIGVLFSRSGPYEAPGRQGYDGAMAAIAEVNARRGFGFELVPVVADPQGNTDRYAALCQQMIRDHRLRHVVGCTTSWSRKEVIPVVEKTDALLWYPCVYEGFEASENVVYVAACANQHLVPLLDFILPRFGRQAALLGSNYIWGWETNRIAREAMLHSGGAVVAERYVPIGDIDIDHLVAEIRQKRPNFILNNLIGPSSYAFLRAYHALGQSDPDFRAEARPVISCNLYEGETLGLGAAAAGHYTVSCYFESLATDANRRFLADLAGAGTGTPITAFFAESYASVMLIADAIARAGTDAIAPVLQAAASRRISSPLGEIVVDPVTHHVALPAHIGRARADGSFEIVQLAGRSIDPDPFLTRTSLHLGDATPRHPAAQGAVLRVVS